MSEMMRVLVVAHGHPSVHVGGGEKHAHGAFRGLARHRGIKATYLYVRDGDAATSSSWLRQEDLNEWSFAETGATGDGTRYVHFGDRRIFRCDYLKCLTEFIAAIEPDVVHFHHYYRIGWDVVTIVRAVAPRSVVVMSLHDYKMLCPGNGHLLMRHRSEPQLCHGPQLVECGICCPDVSQGDLLTRSKAVDEFRQSVDRFIAPSNFASDLYQQNGIARDRIEVIPNGYEGASITDLTPPCNDVLTTFGFFGRNSDIKGLSVLMDAARIATSSGCRFCVHVNGPISDFYACKSPFVFWRGSYDSSSLSTRMADVGWVVVPSVWWENAPLVIDEARAARRPTICSDVGALQATVINDVDGLRFSVGNAGALANSIMRASGNSTLWKRLASNIQPPPSLARTLRQTIALYRPLSGTDPPISGATERTLPIDLE